MLNNIWRKYIKMGQNLRRWLTVLILTITVLGVLTLYVVNIWYGIVATIVLWAAAVFPDWEYLFSLEEDDVGRDY